jgi:hypothetical protein
MLLSDIITLRYHLLYSTSRVVASCVPTVQEIWTQRWTCWTKILELASGMTLD